MKQEYKEIKFDKSTGKFQFDCVNYQDVLKKRPTDHSQFNFHKVSFYALLLITQNTCTHNLNFKDYQLKKGSLITLRKDNIHKFYKSNAKGILLVFTENFIINHAIKLEASKTFLLFNEMLASPKIQLNEVEYNEIITLIDLIRKEYAEVNDNNYASNIVRKFVQILIIKLFRIKSKDNASFENSKYLSMFLAFQALVEKHCFEYKKVSFYAKKMGFTTKTLNNVTQSIIQKTAKAFINDIVIIQSKRLIINSQDSLTQISYQVGFEEPTNFFKYFIKYAGVSPSQFRANYLADATL